VRRVVRRRIRDGVLYAILIGAILAAALLADWGRIRANFFDSSVIRQLWPDIITTAAVNTIIYTAIAFAGGLAVALLLALMKLSPIPPYRWIATAYIEIFRGLPALVVIFLMSFGISLAFDWKPPGGLIGAGLIALIITYSAYMAETLRAGLQAVPRGQIEAARSLGMSAVHTMISVQLPQAVRIVIPPLTNEFVLLIKDTALLSLVGMQYDQVDLTQFGRNGLNTYASATPLIAIAVVYLVISIPLTQLVAWLERRQQRAVAR
jgi:polar amino acid transport system permease protein